MIEAEEKLAQVLPAYEFDAPLVGLVRYGSGHINDTFCVHTQPKEGDCRRYILQRLSSRAFPRPLDVIENMKNITQFIRQRLIENGEDAERGTLTLLPTRMGEPCFTDDEGGVWRLMPFIEGSRCLQRAETPALFYASAKAFGRFQRMLGGFPAETIHEVIPNFHDTPARLARFKEVLSEDRLGRAKEADGEIDFIFRREKDCSVCTDALRRGELPLRVTHNDTKLNNVLMEKARDESLCVIDLDTVMPGLAINDFGDSIRFGANHCAEDEKDLDKVSFDIALFETYAKGFLEEAAPILTEAELAYMPWGAKLMTLECGIRFLTDYLEGDVYFHAQRPEQNLDRCRTQLKLVQDMERQWGQMNAVIARCRAAEKH